MSISDIDIEIYGEWENDTSKFWNWCDHCDRITTVICTVDPYIDELYKDDEIDNTESNWCRVCYCKRKEEI
ncbi:hypothetical protein [Nostoc phage A1]|nr:hypothetical protein [Nostoc phage A1]